MIVSRKNLIVVGISESYADLSHSFIAVETISNGEIVIPLTSDVAFFRSLTKALNILSASLSAYQERLMSSIQVLSTIVANTSRPASARVSATSLHVVVALCFHFLRPFRNQKQSDLYTWRTLFRIYMEDQVFESFSERDRGERSVEDAEARLSHFAHRVSEYGFSFKLAASPDGLKRFLELNVQLMGVKKVPQCLSSRLRARIINSPFVFVCPSSKLQTLTLCAKSSRNMLNERLCHCLALSRRSFPPLVLLSLSHIS